VVCAPDHVSQILPCNLYFSIVGNSHFAVPDRRADGVEPDSDAGPVAADQRRGLGLAIALEESDPERLEEHADLGVERRAARHPGLLAAAEPLADLAPQGQRQDPVHWKVPRLQRAVIAVAADLDRAVQQIFGQAALALDALHDA